MNLNPAHPTRHTHRLALPAWQRKRAVDEGTERWPLASWSQMHGASLIRNLGFDQALRMKE
jgi:hypothetical protein